MPRFNAANVYFTPSEYRLQELLTRDKRLNIPDYQRGFAWGPEKFKELWSDVITTEGQNFNDFILKEETTQQPHFLGAIVAEVPDGLHGDDQIIDGQQRLITVTILLSVLNDFIQRVNEVTLRQSLFNTIFRCTKITDPSNPTTHISRIELNDTQAQSFFVEHVIQPTSSGARTAGLSNAANLTRVQERIKLCIEFFSTNLAAHLGQPSDADYDQKVERLTQTVLLLITVLHVSVKKPDLAYTIFETLNTRGLDLTQADLIKNRIFSRSGADRQPVMQHWTTMIGKLPDRDGAATEYIRHHYASFKDNVKAKDLFKTISTYTSSVRVLSYTQMLVDEADNYSDIADASTGRDAADTYLEQITKDLDITLSYILLLAGAKIFGFANPNFVKLARYVRDFSFRFMTVGRAGDVAQFEEIMGQAARDLRGGTPLDGASPSILELLQQKAPDQVFFDDFKEYRAVKPALGFYILKQIEDHLSGGQGVTLFDHSPVQHLEHIMPKRPTNQGWSHVLNDQRFTSFLHRVGNLLALERDINVAIQNKPFDIKNGTIQTNSLNYGNSRLMLPSRVSAYLNNGLWDFTSIENRQQALAQIALQVWSLQ